MPMVYRMNRESKIRNSDQRGMTLVELMVVVAILSVLSAAAVVSINPTPSLEAQAKLVAQRIAQASRLAIRNGPMGDDVATESGNLSDITSRPLFGVRSRLLIDSDANGRVFMSVQLRVAEEVFEETQSSWLSSDVHNEVGIERQATITPNGYVYSHPGGAPLEILCFPDGRCETTTIYLQNREQNEFFRVTILDIQGLPLVLGGWD